MRVYDGSDVGAPVIAHLCGAAQHTELWSSSPALLIEFYSSSNAGAPTFDGFEARFSFQPATASMYDDDDEEEEEEDAPLEEEDDQEPSTTTTAWPAALPRSTARAANSLTTTTMTTTTKRRTRKH